MNYAQIAGLLGRFALFFSCVMLVPLVLAGSEGEGSFAAFRGFLVAMGTGVGVGTGLTLLGRRRRDDHFFRREGLLVVGVAWWLAAILGAIPLWMSGAIERADDALFETVSGLTTTGATVLGTADNTSIESLPPSLLLWRSLLQWIGGTGVILVFTILLPAMGLTGKNLLDSESVGVNRDERPRMQEQGRALFKLYAGLTALCFLGYLANGMGSFDALCHSFTTMATGGFSTKNQSLGAFQSVGIEITSIVFMFLAGVNFVLMLSVLRGLFTKKSIRWSPEFFAYAKWTVVMILLVTLALRVWGQPMPDPALSTVHDYSSVWTCLRDASFQVVSMVTSTGFGTCDFQNWPGAALVLIMVCMLIGGSTGSTAGGLKIYRLLVCIKLIGFALRRFVRPRTVARLRLGDEVLPNDLISSVLTLVLLWALLTVLGALVLALDPRLDLVSAFSASLSATGCTGPALTTVFPVEVAGETGLGFGFAIGHPAGLDLGPYGGYGDLHGYAKIWLCFQMIAGRLEILAPLVLVLPQLWRK